MYKRLGLAEMDSSNGRMALVGLASTFFVEFLTNNGLIHTMGMP